MTDVPRQGKGKNARMSDNISHSPSLINTSLEFARRPINFASLFGTITVGGYAGITMARSDIAAVAIGLLGAIALTGLVITRLRNGI